MVEKKAYARDLFRDTENHCAITKLLSFDDKFCSDGDCRECGFPILYFMKPENIVVTTKSGYTLTEEELAKFIHEAWMSWVRNIMDTEVITEDRRTRWIKYLVPYDELDEGTKDLDRRQVDIYLNAVLGEKDDDN